MKTSTNIIRLFIIQIFCLFFVEIAICQTETFDILTYTPPKDWKKDVKEAVVSYTNVNTTGGFCIIAIYTSAASAGTPEKDFKKEWNDRVVTPFKAEVNPKTETTISPDGWTAVAGASAIKEENIDAYVLLTVFSGFGKSSTIIATFNDQSYIAQIDSLLGNLSLDKNAPIAKTNSTQLNPVENSNAGNSIFGIWSTTSVSIANYVTSSGSFVGSADASTMEEYTFKAGNTYLYKFFGSASGRQYYTETTGTFKINGKKLTLTPLKRRGGYSGAIHDEKNLLDKASTFDYFIGPNKWEPGPFLNLHKDGKYYMWNDFPYDYFKRISVESPVKTPAATNNETGVEKKSPTTTAAVAEKNPSTSLSPENTEKFGHMTFTPMKNWVMQKYSTAIIFKPSDIPDTRYIETRIMESKAFSGTLQQAFAESWGEALQQLKLISPFTTPYDIITEKKSFKGWEYIQGHGTVKRMEDKSELGYDKYYVNLFVIKLNNRIERIVTVGLRNINGADYSPYNNYYYRDAIEGLCFSLKFDDWKEEPPGALKGNALSGMYGGLKLGGGSLNANYVLFFPNGQVFFGGKFPTEGFEGKNTWVYAEHNIRNWGTYTLQNGKGTINMGYGNVPLKVSGNDLIITTQNTAHTYEKFPSVDGAVFNGKYVFDGDWGGKSPSITFTKDGKFLDEGALNILNHQTTDPDEFNVTAKPGSGTYEIKNYTLLFKYSDGRKVQMVFDGNGFDKKNPGPPSLTLSFNNDIIYRK